MDIGVDSFAAIVADEGSQAQSPQARLADLLDEIEIADGVGLDLFGIGEHHRADFLDSAPTMILAAAAARTSSIRLTSAVTVLSAADPVRVFQEFATLDLISKGRAEMIVGRGSFTEAHSLFGFRLEDYDDLFAEKLDLLLRIRDEPELHWSGRFRPALSGQAILPRPLQAPLPIWLGVGGTPQSFVRAGVLGLPLMVAIIGGEFRRFRPLVDLYREAGRRAGHPAERLKVGIHAFGFVAESDSAAVEAYYPGWARSMTKIGKERGWPPATPQQFDAACSAEGAFLVGGPETVAEKMLHASEVLGGLARVHVQMTSAAVPHAVMKRSIELLGGMVAPIVRAAALTSG
jgi:probable LLM family oxidoreductase